MTGKVDNHYRVVCDTADIKNRYTIRLGRETWLINETARLVQCMAEGVFQDSGSVYLPCYCQLLAIGRPLCALNIGNYFSGSSTFERNSCKCPHVTFRRRAERFDSGNYRHLAFFGNREQLSFPDAEWAGLWAFW